MIGGKGAKKSNKKFGQISISKAYRESSGVNNDFTYQNELYRFGIKILSFGTQLQHLWNTTATSLEHNVLAVWRGA